MTSHFHRQLREKTLETIGRIRESVCTGDAVDYAGYREWVGYMRGMADTLALAEELERID